MILCPEALGDLEMDVSFLKASDFWSVKHRWELGLLLTLDQLGESANKLDLDSTYLEKNRHLCF